MILQQFDQKKSTNPPSNLQTIPCHPLPRGNLVAPPCGTPVMAPPSAPQLGGVPCVAPSAWLRRPRSVRTPVAQWKNELQVELVIYYGSIGRIVIGNTYNDSTIVYSL